MKLYHLYCAIHGGLFVDARCDVWLDQAYTMNSMYSSELCVREFLAGKHVRVEGLDPLDATLVSRMLTSC